MTRVESSLQNKNAFRWLTTAASGFLFVAALLVSGLSGCGGERPIETTESDSSPSAAVAQNTETPQTTSVAPSTSGVDTSPASESSVPPKDAGPGIVCETFLSLLKSGDRLSAEQLLTRTALAVTSKADLQLEPPGSENAKYEVGEVRYATNRHKLAHVDCIVKEAVDGEDFTSTVTWMVRSQNEGWRISGIVLTSEDESLYDLLSFENPDDVARINNMLLGDEAADVQRQASAESSTAASMK